MEDDTVIGLIPHYTENTSGNNEEIEDNNVEITHQLKKKKKKERSWKTDR